MCVRLIGAMGIQTATICLWLSQGGKKLGHMQKRVSAVGGAGQVECPMRKGGRRRSEAHASLNVETHPRLPAWPAIGHPARDKQDGRGIDCCPRNSYNN
jgi:hypothetical protein